MVVVAPTVCVAALVEVALNVPSLFNAREVLGEAESAPAFTV